MTLTPQRSLRPRPNKSSFLDDDFGFVPISAPPQVEEESEQKNLFPSKEIIPSPEIDEISEEGELFPSKAPEEVINVDKIEEISPEEKELGFVKVSPDFEGMFGEDVSNEESEGYASSITDWLKRKGAVTTRELVADVGGLVGDLQNLADIAADWTSEKIYGKEEADRKKAALKEAGIEREFPTSEEIKEKIDKWTKGEYQPKDTLERYMARALSFLAFPGKKTAGRVVSDLGAALGGQVAEEMDAGPAVEFGMTIAGGGLGTKAAGKYAKQAPVKPILERVSEESKRSVAAMTLGKITPEVQKVAEAAKAQNITLPLTAMSSRSVVKGAEKLLEKNVFSRDAFVDLAKAEKGKFLQQWEKNLDVISPSFIENPDIAAQLAQSAATKSEQVLKTTRDTAYRLLEEHIDFSKAHGAELTVSNVGAKTLMKELEKKLETSLIPSATEATTKDTFKRGLDNLKKYQAKIEKDVINSSIKKFDDMKIPAKFSEATQKMKKAVKGSATVQEAEKAIESVVSKNPEVKNLGNVFIKTLKKEVNSGKRKIDLETLMATERSLGDIIDWDVKGTSQQLIKPLRGKFTEAIKSYGNKDPEFKRLFHNAKEAHKDLAKTAWNDLTKSLLTGQFPLSHIEKLKNPSMFKTYEKLFNKSAEGRETFKILRRFALENFIGKSVASAATGDLKAGTLASTLKHKQNQQVLKNLMGDKAYKNAKELGTIADGLTKGAKDFLNPSQSGDVILLAKSLIAPITAVVGVGAKSGLVSIPAVATGASVIYGPKLLASAMTNELLLSSAREAAAAGQHGNKKAFLKAIGEFSTEYLKEVDKVRAAQATLQDSRKKERKSKE